MYFSYDTRCNAYNTILLFYPTTMFWNSTLTPLSHWIGLCWKLHQILLTIHIGSICGLLVFFFYANLDVGENFLYLNSIILMLQSCFTFSWAVIFTEQWVYFKVAWSFLQIHEYVDIKVTYSSNTSNPPAGKKKNHVGTSSLYAVWIFGEKIFSPFALH